MASVPSSGKGHAPAGPDKSVVGHLQDWGCECFGPSLFHVVCVRERVGEYEWREEEEEEEDKEEEMMFMVKTGWTSAK
ncbi:hypothetical protein E4U43_000652 [Claviceps pusilla]|uniref:Uncharacterized protein n=1 Tax=Claviceps pusilla TaxID=123648 RepID=A0A9P7N9V2_9HYPO|nr:hypothetical protein E4U43_000652 [Claviceps pusilla]